MASSRSPRRAHHRPRTTTPAERGSAVVFAEPSSTADPGPGVGPVVVLGEWWEEMQECLDSRPVKFARNLNFRSGIASSIKAGVAFLDASATAFAIVLGDQPLISSSVTNKVIEAYAEDLYGIVIPVYNHRRGHPLLVDMKYRKEIEQLNLEEGLRKLRHHFPEDVLEVEVDAPGILVDIDTREDYQKARD